MITSPLLSNVRYLQAQSNDNASKSSAY